VQRLAGQVRADVLEQEGHAMERPVADESLPRLRARSVEAGQNDGVQLRVDLFDAPDGRLDQLGGRDLALADELCLRRGVEGGKGIVHLRRGVPALSCRCEIEGALRLRASCPRLQCRRAEVSVIS
jgi:hypothetical protein